MLDLFNDKIVSVDYNRDQGFLTGMGIDAKDKTKNGDEAKTGNYTGGKGGTTRSSATSRPRAPRTAARPRWRTAWPRTKDINVVYTINEPAAAGAPRRCRPPGSTAH